MMRRDFLSLSAAAMVPVRKDAPPIRSIDVFQVVYPTKAYFRFFENSERPTVVVRVTTDDPKLTGWGQSVPSPVWSYESVDTVLATYKRLIPALQGQNPTDLANAHQIMNRLIGPSFSTGAPIAKAGIDLALFDLTGRLLGQSAAQRWGRTGRDHMTLSWTLNPRRLEEVEALVAEGLSRGYRHFNVKVTPDAAFDLELCRLVKRLVPDGFLWADANGGYDEATALTVAPQLADLGVAVLEQPLPANRMSAYRRLKQQGALPILMDEGIVSAVELEEFIRLGLLDGVAMKPARCGGLTEARRQIELLRDAGLWVLGSGLCDPDLSLAASLLLYGAYDLDRPAALNGPQFLETTLLRVPFEVHAGQIEVPRGPGLGVEINDRRMGTDES